MKNLNDSFKWNRLEGVRITSDFDMPVVYMQRVSAPSAVQDFSFTSLRSTEISLSTHAISKVQIRTAISSHGIFLSKASSVLSAEAT